MKKYFRADGLKVDGHPFVVLKETNLSYVGATWSYFDGLVWHLSMQALSERLLRKPFSRRVFNLKVTKIEFEVFYDLKKERYGFSKEVQQRYEKLDKNKFHPYWDSGRLVEENVSHELEQ